MGIKHMGTKYMGASGRLKLDKSDTSGFTLVEMLVVLAILGLLVMVALPSVRSRDGADLRAIGQALMADLRLLRDEAIRRNARTTFVPLANGYALRPSGRTTGLPAHVALTFEVGRPGLLLDGKDLIDFFPDGTSSGGVLTLRRGGSGAHVLVEGLNGRVRLHEQQ